MKFVIYPQMSHCVKCLIKMWKLFNVDFTAFFNKTLYDI